MKLFNIGYFVILCLVGVLCLYLAPSKLGQINNVYFVETTMAKMVAKSGNVQLDSKETASLVLNE